VWAFETKCEGTTSGQGRHFQVSPQLLSQITDKACASASAAARQACIEAAEIAALINLDSEIGPACGQLQDRALADCVHRMKNGRSDVPWLRQVLRDALNRYSPNHGAATNPDSGTSGAVAPPESKPQQTTANKLERDSSSAQKKDDSPYCLFILSRVRRHDVAYTRMDQIPPECQEMGEMKEALSDNRPPVEFGDPDEKMIRQSVEELERQLGASSPIREQMPPAPVDQSEQGTSR
jgi:hypothetical protein